MYPPGQLLHPNKIINIKKNIHTLESVYVSYTNTHTGMNYFYAYFFKRGKFVSTFRASELQENPSHYSPFPCAEFGEAEGWAQEWLQSPQ
jgi:hypothetical protein